jgi:hypothetical protein
VRRKLIEVVPFAEDSNMFSTAANRRSSRRQSGVTLTEVVVGSALLVIAVVPLLRALTMAQSTSATIERKTQSLILAQAKLEELRAKSIHHYESSFRETSQTLAESYLCTVTDDEDPALRLVSVSVGYDGNADGHLSEAEIEVNLSTYLARRS